jgi:predicted AAA+ superfamily ATPase
VSDSPLLENPLFGKLPFELQENLRSMNPWWNGLPGPEIPRFRRWPYDRLRRLIDHGITPATVLRGPRRVGKTVITRQLIDGLLADGVEASRILYVSFDELPTLRRIKEPVLALARWFEDAVLGSKFNESARQGRRAYLFLDEVQNLDAWAPQLKNLVDNHSVKVLVTGSSSLRIEAGRDSLAGRVTTLDIGPFFLKEIAGLRFGYSEAPFWLEKDIRRLADADFWRELVLHGKRDADVRLRVYSLFSDRGAYPIAHDNPDVGWDELASHLNETVIRRAIQHDLRLGARGQKRDERLLEEVFRLCCRYDGQAPGPSVFVPEIQQTLAANIGWTRILSYLRFLDGTLLVRLISPLELRLKRQKAPPKLCLCDHALRASWTQELIPLDQKGLEANPHLSDLAGHIAEGVLGYFFASIPDLQVAHFPARGVEPEVDFVLTVGTHRIPVEVKYRKRIDPYGDTLGLRAFIEKAAYNAPFGILVTLLDDVQVADPRIITIPMSSVLWMR